MNTALTALASLSIVTIGAAAIGAGFALIVIRSAR